MTSTANKVELTSIASATVPRPGKVLFRPRHPGGIPMVYIVFDSLPFREHEG